MRVRKLALVGVFVVVGSLLFAAIALGQPVGAGREAPNVPPPTVAPTNTPTVTPTPAASDMTLTGRVTDAVTHQGIPNATVSVTSCFPRAYAATTGADGSYSLLLPGAYFTCGLAPLRVEAAGYQPFERTFGTDDLRLQPIRDFALSPLHRIYLPLLQYSS